jgi:hypothetical protein
MTLGLVAFGFVSANDKPDPPADDARMKALWADLEKGEAVAMRALLKLSARPDEAVAFLKNKMKPLKLDAEQARALIDWLGSDNEETWKGAFEELEYFDPRLAIDLETLMAEVTKAPARQRLVEVMSGPGLSQTALSPGIVRGQFPSGRVQSWG